jgi:hypothetical protein
MKRLVIALFAVLLFVVPMQAQTSRSVVLAWTASTSTGAAYNIYRASGACAPSLTFTKIGSVAAGVVTFTDTAVTVGAFCYQVTATLNGEESLPSNQSSAVILPTPPTALTTTPN